jgi:hypothetical protein
MSNQGLTSKGGKKIRFITASGKSLLAPYFVIPGKGRASRIQYGAGSGIREFRSVLDPGFHPPLRRESLLAGSGTESGEIIYYRTIRVDRNLWTLLI